MKITIRQNKECKACRIITGRSLRVVILAVLFFLFLADSDAQDFIGGSTPAVRPADAPRISRLIRDDTYFDRSLRGVSKPYPPSLMFLKDQGAWYSPFTRPGMHGRYDLRSWHSQISPSHMEKWNTNGLEDSEVSR